MASVCDKKRYVYRAVTLYDKMKLLFKIKK